jgi:hypothetical protein
VRIRVLEIRLAANESDDGIGQGRRTHDGGTSANSAIEIQHAIVPADKV